MPWRTLLIFKSGMDDLQETPATERLGGFKTVECNSQEKGTLNGAKCASKIDRSGGVIKLSCSNRYGCRKLKVWRMLKYYAVY